MNTTNINVNEIRRGGRPLDGEGSVQHHADTNLKIGNA